MKFNKWTLGLAAVGVVSLASVARAEETPAPANLLTAVPSTTLSGYVDVSASLNFGSRNGISDPTAVPNYNLDNGSVNLKRNAFSLNVVDIALDKPMDEGQWAAGYHVELWFGPDAVGIGTSLDGSSGDTMAASIRQAYISLRTPVGGSEIDWKLGVFDTLIGYEGLSSPSNPNYSHSYGWNIEPTTHTGLLGSYKVCDAVSVQAGVANTSYHSGYDAGINDTALYNPTIMGLVSLTAPDSWGWAKGANLSVGAIHTSGSFGIGATSLYAGATVPTPWSTLKTGVALDYLNETDQNFGGHAHQNSIWTAAAYASWQATDKLAVNLRGEYLDNRDDNGTSGNSQYPFTTTPGIFGNNAEEVTVDAQYDLWKNVLTRVEFRWDHVEHGVAFSNGASSAGSPDTANAYLFAVQAIYKF